MARIITFYVPNHFQKKVTADPTQRRGEVIEITRGKKAACEDVTQTALLGAPRSSTSANFSGGDFLALISAVVWAVAGGASTSR